MPYKDLGIVEPGSTIYLDLESYGASGESITLSGLAVTDIEVYKDGSVTQRGSDAGYTLLDTDGIDFDGITGIHGLSISLADNTTAGFWAAGSSYRVVVSSVTINTQTVNLTLATFRIGYPSAILNTTIATLSTQTSFTLTTGPAEDDALNGCVALIHDVASAVQKGFAVVSDYTGASKTVTLTAGTTFTVAATDNISFFPPVNAAWSGLSAPVAQTGNDNGADINDILTDTGTTLQAELDGIQADTEDIQTRLPAALTAGGNIKADALAWNGLTTVALPLVPSVAGRTLDVSAGGEAGIDWGNVGSASAMVTLSQTEIGAVLSVQSLASNSITSSTFSAGAIDAAAIANGAIDAATFAADVDAEARSWLGLASANLDTQLADLPTVAEFEARTLVAANYSTVTTAQVNAEMLDVLNVDTLIDGKTFVQAVQYVSAITAGRISGAGTGTEVFKGLDESTTRVTVTVDGSGNRTDIVYG
jgi:hypothetical protein